MRIASLFACTLLAVLPPFAATAAATPAAVADYMLSGGLDDSLGNGPALLPVGSMATSFTTLDLDGGNRQVLQVPAGAGLRLDLGALLPLDSYSILVRLSLDSTGSYAKILDTNDLQSDFGLYALAGNLRYYSLGSANSNAFSAQSVHQVVVTREADGRYSGYLDGALQFQFTDTGNNQLSAIGADRVLHVLRDDATTSNSEESGALLVRLSLYDRALTAQEVKALDPTIVFADGFEPAR